jgi:hypothetical protein
MQKFAIITATTATILCAGLLGSHRAEAMISGMSSGLRASIDETRLNQSVNYVCRWTYWGGRRCWWRHYGYYRPYYYGSYYHRPYWGYRYRAWQY